MSREIFTRNIINGIYDINNPDRAEALFKEINAINDFSHKFKIVCNKESCEINFLFDPDSTQKSILQTIVDNHKNNN